MCTCRSTLHSYASREQSSSQRPVSIYINIRYLSPLEQKQRMDSLRQTNKSLQLKITRLKEKLSTVIAEQGVTLDEDISNDLCQVMAEVEQQPNNKLQSFKDIFWNQQKEAAKKTGNKSKCTCILLLLYMFSGIFHRYFMCSKIILA